MIFHTSEHSHEHAYDHVYIRTIGPHTQAAGVGGGGMREASYHIVRDSFRTDRDTTNSMQWCIAFWGFPVASINLGIPAPELHYSDRT